MTLKELVYDVREAFKLMSDDSQITNTYIAWLIDRARSSVMAQRYSDPRTVVPAVEYQKFTTSIGVNGVSTTPIPSVIKTTGNAHASLKIYGVGVADTMLNIPLNVVTVERLPYVGSNPFTSDQIYCAIDEGGYIAFNSKNNLYRLIDSVVVRGLFESPEEAYAISNPGQDFMNAKYPMADLTRLEAMKIVEDKMRIVLGIPKDNLNDATEERLDQNPQGNK